ncbi:hypothetical protein [uncultured Lacinutrix sp.]|uniref:hypothetical protein n=1 Tax=uncultured Lacinutrix sp. TaxID=574032 RepID=UPI00261A3042|nr:hypothetical protein [uncultured Lacinutrix sp.]
MTQIETTKVPIWYWIVAILALLWNAMGVVAYIGQAYMSEEVLTQMSETDQQMYANLPAWYTAAFAIAVFAGALGCLALVLRKKWAYNILLVSLIAAIAQMSYLSFVLEMANAMTPLIIIVGVALVFLAKHGTKKGWIS